MLAGWGNLGWATALRLADWFVTAPPIRWIWSGPARDEVSEVLGEFRPGDRESVREMMAGRYLLAARPVDMHGSSPFAADIADPAWRDELHSFSWLRHFRSARDPGERSFARTLTLDWISREGKVNRTSWAPALCARRVLNWIRHYRLLVDDATPEQSAIITRSLGMQIQSLKLRAGLAADPVDRLLSAVALAAVALCDDRRQKILTMRMGRLDELLEAQVDADGLHRSRSPKVQLDLLVELETLRQAVLRGQAELGAQLDAVVENMHRALDAVSLSTGDPGFFNGTGQLPHDLVVAVQVQNAARFQGSGITGGYGRLVGGRSVLVADGGFVPPAAYAGQLHAGALAFEFSRGAELIVGNCGPAPPELAAQGTAFRQGIAHSSITVSDASAARIVARGPFAGRVLPIGPQGQVAVGDDEETLLVRSEAYSQRYGVVIERHLTLMAEGKSLVGQDRLTLGRARGGAMAIARFHLALGTAVEKSAEDDMLRLRLASGALWTFLWEGAHMHIEDSVRQSSYFGFHRTKQIVLEAPADRDREIAWIFTMDD